MPKKGLIFSLTVILLLTGAERSHALTAEEWLQKVDRQMMLTSAEYSAKMIIHAANGVERVFSFEGKVAGEAFALLEFIDPPRQKGTRYLKRGESLWIYFPRQDRTLQIQGHMLRQGVQGGDLSYEDMTESSSLLEKYDSEITSENDTSLTLQLSGKDLSVSYPYREIVIDKHNSLPLKSTYRDASKRPIKELTILEIKRFGDRMYPTVTLIRSLLVEDKWTRFEVESISFDTRFTPDTFTKKNLER